MSGKHDLTGVGRFQTDPADGPATVIVQQDQRGLFQIESAALDSAPAPRGDCLDKSLPVHCAD